MPTSQPSAELIERLQRRRRGYLFLQAIGFLIWQTGYLAMQPQDFDALHTANHVKMAAYAIWTILLLAFLATGGGPFLPRAVRAVLNDEVAIEHRRRAAEMGFWAAMAAGLGGYGVGLFEPLVARQVIHIVLSAGVGAALITFFVLEWRAEPHD